MKKEINYGLTYINKKEEIIIDEIFFYLYAIQGNK